MSGFFANTQLLPAGRATGAARPDERDATLQAEVLSLFDELRDRLLRYSMSFGLSLHDGEDVLQEVFLALFRHLQADKSRENLPGWAYRTTHNLSLRRRAHLHVELRRLEPEGNSPAAEYDLLACCPDSTPGPEEQLLYLERQHLLRAVLHALPINDQLCLRLRSEGCRYREIASIVGISLGSVAASLARSFQRMERMEGQ